MIFKGNPGTGKTTMARIIGKIFNEIGYLQGGELIEAERADLVGNILAILHKNKNYWNGPWVEFCLLMKLIHWPEEVRRILVKNP